MRQSVNIFLAAAIMALTGCVRDTFHDKEEGAAETADGSVHLSIALPAPAAVNPTGTRAGAADFDALRNLNVVVLRDDDDDPETKVGDGTAINAIIYVDLTTVQDGDGMAGGDQVRWRTDGTNRGVHFAKEWFDYLGVPAAEAVFILVGNYGEQISIDQAGTAGELRELKDDSVDIPGSVGSKHMMYGESVELSVGDPEHDAHIVTGGHENGRSLKVGLKRTAAMLTVKIDGADLAGDVVITPLSVSLHNVPAWCYLGKDNVVTTTPGGTTPIADAVVARGESYTAADLGWGRIASVASGLANTTPVVGAHYTDENIGGSVENPNYAHEPIRPVFLFENLHGGDAFGAPNTETGQAVKRPRDAAGTSEAAIDAVAGACSYLVVRARYQQLNPDQSVARGGDVMYRVFLGADIWQNFDVERNTYYRLTLDLNNTAVGEGNASWRLEHGISDVSALSESDFTLNAAGETILIDEQIAKPNNNGVRITYDQGLSQRDANGDTEYLSWVLGSAWIDFPLDSYSYGNSIKHDTQTQTGGYMQFRVHVDPMTETDGVGANEGYVRRVSFTIGKNNNTYTSQKITITQYGPMVIQVGQEDPRLTQPILDQLAAAGKSLPLTILLDRVDRDAMPWGFGGETIVNQGSGYANALNLVQNHGTVAAGYLPLGKPAYSGGAASAMMHAAFLNYYQWNPAAGFTAGTTLTPAPDISTIGTYLSDPAYNPANPAVPNSIPSRGEWRLLEMLEQAGFEVFDHRHEPLPWIDYWTSDAVQGSATLSWVYRTGGGNGDSTDGVDRATPVRYRMVYMSN